MKRFIISIFAVCLFATSLSAVPARPGKMTVRQPDGSRIEIYKHGDEFGHWITDTRGRVLIKEEDGFYRVRQGADISGIRKTALAKRTARQAVYTGKSNRAKIASGTKHFLVILVEFKDVKFSTENPKQDFTNLLNQKGYSANGGTGSANDFYYDNSHGSFNPVFDVYGPVTLANPMKYYGENDKNGNDKHPEEAVLEGLNGIKNQVDFSQFDNNGDGCVDLVFMYYAGYGEADYGDEDTIWPHQWELSGSGFSFSSNGVRADSYACSNELVLDEKTFAERLCSIGTACHEFGHAMGLPDLYDTDYDDNGYAAGMLAFSTMDAGAYNNDGRTPPYFTAEERICLGWLDESDIKEFSASGNVTLPSVIENVFYKTPTDQDGEYFVYECRGSNGWDAGLPAHGLIVTHVDKSSRAVSLGQYSCSAADLWSNWAAYNYINGNGSHPCCYIIPAADQSNLLFGYKYYQEYQTYYIDDSKYPLFPFPGQNKVTTYTPVSWNGVESDFSLSNIAYSNNTVTFAVTVPSEGVDYHTIANPGQGKYAIGSSFALQLVEAAARPVSSVSWYYDGSPVSGDSVTLSTAGGHTIDAVVVLLDGKTQTITLDIQVQ